MASRQTRYSTRQRSEGGPDSGSNGDTIRGSQADYEERARQAEAESARLRAEIAELERADLEARRGELVEGAVRRRTDVAPPQPAAPSFKEPRPADPPTYKGKNPKDHQE